MGREVPLGWHEGDDTACSLLSPTPLPLSRTVLLPPKRKGQVWQALGNHAERTSEGNLKIIVLSEVGRTVKKKTKKTPCDITCMWTLLDTNELAAEQK